MLPGNWPVCLTKRALQANWRTAVVELLDTFPVLLRYISDERTVDWRFLLPHGPGQAVLCIGGALSPAPLVLAQMCERVVVLDRDLALGFLTVRARQEGCDNIELVALVPGQKPAFPLHEHFTLVAALRQAPGWLGVRWRQWAWADLVALVAPEGQLYLELETPAICLPPVLARWRLRRLGLATALCYWPKPTFNQGELIVPLHDRRLQRYYLDHIFFASSVRRRLLRALLRVAVTCRLFTLTLPGYSVVAGRAGDWA